MLPDLNRLRVFAAIYEAGSVVEAARSLHVTQPAVSQSLKKLERELGVSLFVRLHKKLVATREGTALHELFAPMLEQLSMGVRSIKRGQEVPSGHLRVGAPVEFGQTILPGIFASFQKRHPEVNFTMELGHPTKLLPRLEEGHLDLSFMDIFAHRWELDDALALYAIEPMLEEELLLVGATEYCEREVAPYTPEKLKEARYIAYSSHAPSLRSWWRHHVADEKNALPLVLIVESVRAALEAVRCGMGLAILPVHTKGGKDAVGSAIAEGILRAVPSPKGATSQRNWISLLQLQDKIPTLTEKAFVRHCHESIRAWHGDDVLYSGD